MKDRLLIIIALFFLTNCSDEKIPDKKTENKPLDTINYLDFKFAKVSAFATVDPFDPNDVFYTKKMDPSKFHDTINRDLDDKQIKYLGEILSGKLNKDTTTERLLADCFYPRHNIIFLNDQDSIVNYISVCFECNRVAASKYGKASMDNYSDFFNSVGLKVFDRPDYYKTYYDSLSKLRPNR
jgi:hypothetical protein